MRKFKWNNSILFYCIYVHRQMYVTYVWQRHTKNILTYVVGSSRKITGGLFTSSSAMDNRFNSPPDNKCPIVSAALPNRNKSRISSICKIYDQTIQIFFSLYHQLFYDANIRKASIFEFNFMMMMIFYNFAKINFRLFLFLNDFQIWWERERTKKTRIKNL